MANICEYKVIVKGKKNGCYAFFGSMSALDDKFIVEEHGTDDNYEVFFRGNCKWAVDCYCDAFKGEKPVKLPEDADEALDEAQTKYWYNTVQERSEMFEVEVMCNSADIEYDPEHLEDFTVFEHYKCGKPIDSECPEELKIEIDNEEWLLI